jgi:RNA polymerase sigma factor (sigma-70 family)
MDEKKLDLNEFLADQFESNRARLRAVAYRMLGSTGEVDDAAQETWLRLSRSDTSAVENLGGWLTTVVARVCLDMLRSRKSRREEPMGPHVPEPVADDAHGRDAEMADSVGAALLVVLETLAPAERLAFVLHDMFAVPFEEIAPIVGRTPAAARQLASRARRRVQGTPPPDAGFDRRKKIVDAFLKASRESDFEGLLAVLCWTPTWCSAPMLPHNDWARSPKSAAPRPWPKPSKGARRPPSRRWSMVRWRSPSSSAGSCVSCCTLP